MKNKISSTPIILLLLAFTLGSCMQEKKPNSTYANKIQKTRIETDNQFRNSEESILPAEDLQTFEGLEYFEIKPEYNIIANYELIKDGEVFEMKTSTERLPVYKKFAKLTFQIDDKEYRLFAYQNQKVKIDDEYKDYLFIPFTDLTNGESTYGGGRYMDIKESNSNTVVLDFNTSYNPYCVYNDKFSCPIPPLENHLDVKIPAGVKDYKKKSKHAEH